MNQSFCSIALVLVLTGCAAPLLQAPPAGVPATVAAPEIRNGDTWTYRVRDGYTGLERGTQRYHVVEASGERLSVAVSGEGRLDETYVYDREWNGLKHPATNLQSFEYRPPYPAFAFPLAAGKLWRARVIAADPADGRRFPVSVNGSVLGWEKVTVPAGTFDALKIKRVVFIGYWVLGVRDQSEIVEYEWYAPAVKQTVRREASSRYLSYLTGTRPPGLRYARGGGGEGTRMVEDDWLVYELESYSLR